MTPPRLSIVAPMYNEARILPEFVARCTRAAEQCELPFELVIVDDASNDDTPLVLAGLKSDGRVRHCRLRSNVGQFRATQAGLREARGDWIAVLDGDLQDPPEQVAGLVAAASGAAPSVMAVLAVKSRRDDPFFFLMGQFLFHRLQHALSRVALPRGAGSYCLMRAAVAHRVALADLRHANLAAVVGVAASALGGQLLAVPYDKGPRYDRNTRVGWRGLIAEAVGSLAVTGALARLLGVLAIGFGVSAVAVRGHPLASSAMLVVTALATVSSLWVGYRTQRALRRVRAPQGPN